MAKSTLTMLNPYIKDVCKIGQGADCCRYLVASSKGLDCSKFLLEDKRVIDRAWTIAAHVAQGDNCDGKEQL